MMKRLSLTSLAGLACLAAATVLTGCGGAVSFPDVQPEAAQVPMGTIHGSDYGGHAPLVGAKVFVMQVGTGGYGSKVTSLIPSAGLTTSDYYSTYTTAKDTTTASPTNGMFYVLTDSRGDYALSGDYSCTAGDPVYLYASGGNPETLPTVTVTGATGTVYNGNLLVTFNTSGTQLLYQGESIQFNNFTGGGNYSGFAGTTQTVSSVNLTTSSFAVLLGATSSGVGYQAFSASVTQSASSVVSNAAVANIALLGNCPGGGPDTIVSATGTDDANGKLLVTFTTTGSAIQFTAGEQVSFAGVTGAYTAFNGTTQTVSAMNLTSNTFAVELGTYSGNPGSGAISGTATASTSNFSYLNFVYMNEVSTAAAMTALAPFASTTANNDALHIGTSSTNLAGLQRAVLNAANLYDIQGSVVGSGGDGETHIARATTPTNTGGTVPQTLVNTLGNLLANCVDSANTYNGAYNTGGTQSAQCTALFANATSDGTTTGTKPNDTATAMLNIAHHPAGEPSGNTTFMSGLFNSISGNEPFQPTLSTAPNDFTVGISYTGNGLTSPGNVAIDASGNAWITGNGDVVELSSNGTPLSGTTGYAASTGFQNRSPAIDLSGNLWYITVTGTGAGYVGKMNSAGVVQSGLGYDIQALIGPYSLAVDTNNNIWVANGQSTQVADNYAAYVTELSNAGATLNTFNANTTGGTSGANVLLGPYGIALDGNGLMWITGLASGNVASLTTTGTVGTINWYNNTSSTASNAPAFLTIDQNNKLWVPNQNTNFVQTVTPSAATSSGTRTWNYSYPNYTGGGLSASTGADAAAVDGANNVWVMGTAQKYVSEFSNAGTPLTPAGGYSGGFGTSGGSRLSIDGSGDIWMPVGGGNSVIQMIGVATPVVTPMVSAAATGTPSKEP